LIELHRSLMNALKKEKAPGQHCGTPEITSKGREKV
jgi:hypothetical protein